MSFETEGQALLNVFSSLLSFLQLNGCFANGQRLKWALHLCMLLPMAPYLINLVSIYGAQHNAPAFSQLEPHPAQTLAARSKEYFRSVLSNQSSTYEAAYQEYKRRYTIVPPQGFQEWYKMANLANIPIIDEYDSIHHSTAPLLSLSGKQIQKTILQTYQQRGADLWLCQFSKASSSTQCRHPFRTFDRHISLLFNTLLANVTDLPDVQFLVNHIDEPRVVPHTHKAGSSQYQSVAIQDYSRKPTWDLLTEVCSWDNKEADEMDDTEFFGLPFVADISSAKDLCQHPEYSHRYGLFVSPVSFRPIRGPVPVFSTGTLSTMGDIMFPSPAYIEKEFLYDASKDIDWEKKQHNLYWAGSTTGGFANKTNWPLFHRQRFVEIGQNLKKQNYYLRKTPGGIKKVMSPFRNGRLFHISFTRIFQCSWKVCHDQHAYFRTRAWADKDEALKSTLAFDIDGNGISGRYYKLLASNSVPLKQTLLREWHDDRLIPWLHYIPVSQSMEELPELVFYLTSTNSGRELSRQIAEAGKKWYSQAFRQVDLTIYTYRLLLEMARLQDLLREAGSG